MKTLRVCIGTRRLKREAELTLGWVSVRSWAGEPALHHVSKAVSNPNLVPSWALPSSSRRELWAQPGYKLFPRAQGPLQACGSISRRACIPYESCPAARGVTASPVQPFPGWKATANLCEMLSDGAQRAVKLIRLFSGSHVRRKRGSAEKEKSREVGENCIYFQVGHERGQLAVASA